MKKWECSVESYQLTPESMEFSRRFYEKCRRLGLVFNQLHGVPDDRLFSNDANIALDCIINNKPIPPDVEQRLLETKPADKEEPEVDIEELFKPL